MSDAVIQIKDLHKSYNGVETIKGIDLSVAEGQVFALLGPNGAGKTTTTEIMEGYRSRDKGSVSILGFDPAEGGADFKAQIGIVLQSNGVEPHLSVAETIELYSGFYPHPRPVDEVIELVGLSEKRNERVRKLSGGQQRRLDVAIALAGDPKVLFLDEPTEGFDPSAKRNAWAIIKNLADLGKTIFLTTHYMDEAEYLADYVAIINHGVIVSEGSAKTIAGRDKAKTTIRFRLSPAVPALPKTFGPVGKQAEKTIEVDTQDSVMILGKLITWAQANRVQLEGLEVTQPSLEDVYLKITQDSEVPDA